MSFDVFGYLQRPWFFSCLSRLSFTCEEQQKKNYLKNVESSRTLWELAIASLAWLSTHQLCSQVEPSYNRHIRSTRFTNLSLYERNVSTPLSLRPFCHNSIDLNFQITDTIAQEQFQHLQHNSTTISELSGQMTGNDNQYLNKHSAGKIVVRNLDASHLSQLCRSPFVKVNLRISLPIQYVCGCVRQVVELPI